MRAYRCAGCLIELPEMLAFSISASDPPLLRRIVRWEGSAAT
jgi:hypothetical protein